MSENFRFLERLTINLILLLYQLYKTWRYFFFPTTYAFFALRFFAWKFFVVLCRLIRRVCEEAVARVFFIINELADFAFLPHLADALSKFFPM